MKIGDRVMIMEKGIYEHWLGTILEIFPAGLYDEKEIATIQYKDSVNKGQFRTEDLLLRS
jgi:hypothetical protein